MKLLLISLMFVGLLPYEVGSMSHEPTNTIQNKTDVQTPPETQHFLQFYVTGVTDANHQRKIQDFLSLKSSVYMVRMDRTTRICFIILQPGADLSEDFLDLELENLGYYISCYRKGIYGVDKPYSKENFQCN